MDRNHTDKDNIIDTYLSKIYLPLFLFNCQKAIHLAISTYFCMYL